MKNKILVLFFALLGLNSCYKIESTPAEQIREKALLDYMLYEIIEISESDDCENHLRWAYVAYGSKSCGEPVGYIPYSLDIDVDDFLEKVKKHAEAERIFNEKWDITSDCSVEPEPVSLICVDNKPLLRY